ncbi:MAG: RNA polymerase sigma factor RpoD/SigA [Nanoarchaeota archaeon]
MEYQTNILSLYCRETKRYPFLTREEEAYLDEEIMLRRKALLEALSSYDAAFVREYLAAKNARKLSARKNDFFGGYKYSKREVTQKSETECQKSEAEGKEAEGEEAEESKAEDRLEKNFRKINGAKAGKKSGINLGELSRQCLQKLDEEIAYLAYSGLVDYGKNNYGKNNNYYGKNNHSGRNNYSRRNSNGRNGRNQGQELQAREKLQEHKSNIERLVAEWKKSCQPYIVSNLRLAMGISRKYRYRGLELGDLVQEGNIGLLKATDRYDPSRGAKFSTYAGWWIRCCIVRAIAEKGRNVRIPVHTSDALYKINRAKAVLFTQKGSASDEDIAQRTGLPMHVIQKISGFLGLELSLDNFLDPDDPATFEDRLADGRYSPEDEAREQESKAKVERILQCLPPHTRYVIEKRYGFGGRSCTLRELGNEAAISKNKISRERVRQLQKEAERKLRRKMGLSSELSDFM